MVSLRTTVGKMSGRILTKLVSSMLVLAIVFLSLAVYSVEAGRQALEETVGTESMEMARLFAMSVDRGIYSKLHEMTIIALGNHMRSFLNASNAEFEAMEDPELYIDQRDAEWTSVPDSELSPFMLSIIENALSVDLITRLDLHYIREHGIDIYGEVQVTNRYGATVAMTTRSADYRQDDEAWWHAAKDNGSCVGALEVDPMTATYGIPISVSVLNEDNEFMGVMRAFVDSTAVVMEAQFESRVFETTEIDILTPDMRLIYSTHAFRTYEDVSSEDYAQNIVGESGYFMSEEAGRERMYSYSISPGYIEYEGSNWIFLMSHDTAEVLSSVISLRSEILFMSALLLMVFIAVALALSASVTRPVQLLKQATSRMADGHLDERVNIRSRDELGELATTFNDMASELEELYEDLETKVQERSKEVDAANAKLQILGSITRHDALNQLTIMRGWLSLVAENVKDPEVASHVAKVQTAAVTLEAQLKFTGTYEKVGVTRPEWIDTKQSVDLTMPGLDLRGAKLVNGLRGLTVYADPMFPKVFRNLVENSVKHGEGTTRISIAYEEREDGVVIVVEDDGGGIPSDRKSSLFERVRDSSGRAGYGLYLSKAILDITSITIEENGTPGVGARFEIRVPPGKYRISKPAGK